LSLVKTSSEKTASPLDKITYTLTYSNLGSSPVFNAVLTDNLPPTSQMTYLTGTASNGGVYNAATNTLTWTIASVAPGTSVSVTYQIQASLISANNKMTTLDNKACLSYATGSVCASNSVTVQGAYTIHLAVYNQAGELIETLAAFEVGSPMSDFTIQNGVITTDSQTAVLLYNGVVIGTWDATNGSGAKVTNGTYLIKLESTDPFGVTTTITKNVIVDISRSTLTVAIYNEAGEIVKTFTQVEIQNLLGGGVAGALLPADFNVGETKLSTTTLVVGYTAGANNSLTITLGSGRSFTWDGVGDNGTFLTSGTYFLEVTSTQQNQPNQQIIMPVHVQNNGKDGINGIVLAPNPIYLSKTTQAKFLLNPATGQLTSVSVRIYTVAGELIETLANKPGVPTEVDWDMTLHYHASGTYLAVVEPSSSKGLMGRTILKVQIIH